MALGSCTSIRPYVRHAEEVAARTGRRGLRHQRRYAEDCADCEKPGALLDHIDRNIEFAGPLDDSQRARLLEIADHCPVHKTLTSRIVIKTRLI